MNIKNYLNGVVLAIIALASPTSNICAKPQPDYTLVFHISPAVEVSNLSLDWPGFPSNIGLPDHLSQRSNWNAVIGFGSSIPSTDLCISWDDKDGHHSDTINLKNLSKEPQPWGADFKLDWGQDGFKLSVSTLYKKGSSVGVLNGDYEILYQKRK